MYENAFHLDIVAPNRVVFQGEASSFTAPGVLGSFQVLFNHAPLLAELEAGRMVVKGKDGVDHVFAVSGGFVEVRDNKATVLADSAESQEEIDLRRAEASRGRAEQRIKEREPGTDIDRARASLARAMNRLRVGRSS
jgi:F-type H+-transporting ATPase subunit epsilon